MRAYTIHYRLHLYDEDEKQVSFLARNKQDAYDKAVFEIIPLMEGESPYHTYVYSVTYNNGNYKIFNG